MGCCVLPAPSPQPQEGGLIRSPSASNASQMQPTSSVFLKNILFIYFKEKGRKGEREGEKHRCARETSISCLLHASQLGASPNPGTCPDWESNQRPFSLWDDAQPTEPLQSAPTSSAFSIFRLCLIQGWVAYGRMGYISAHIVCVDLASSLCAEGIFGAPSQHSEGIPGWS